MNLRVNLTKRVMTEEGLLDRRRIRHVPAELLAQHLRIVRVHLHIELRPRDGDIRHAAIQQLAVRL